MSTPTLLRAIPSTEPTDFREFLNCLGIDAPARGDHAGYAELFEELRALEALGLVEVERTGGSIESLMLTPLGAERVRELRDE